jgi:hypothetical protein
MSPLTVPGLRPPATTDLPVPAQADGRAVGAAGQHGAVARAAAQLAPVLPAALSDLGRTLSQEGLAKAADALGNRTVDLAQNLLQQFASEALGSAGDGATVSFDAASIDTSASASGSASHSSGADGVRDSAAFSLNENAHFIGTGKITTADGQSFDFQIEVQYDVAVQGQFASVRPAPASAPPVASAVAPAVAPASAAPVVSAAAAGEGSLKARQIKDIAFPGSLAELLTLISHELSGALPAAPPPAIDVHPGGQLSLRLLHLVASGKAPASGPDQAKAPANSKALAAAYAAQASPAAPEVPAAPAAPAEAVPA